MTAPWAAIAVMLAISIPAWGAKGVWDPQDFGAVPDGKTLCTEAIQKAIEACTAAGGGTVRLTGGKFLSGTIYLRNGVTIEIAAGTTLLGSTNIADYPHNVPAVRSYTDNYVKQSLIAGEGLHDIGLVGTGTIDGQGPSFKMADKKRPYENRPYIIRLVNCRGVVIEDITLRHSAMWMQHYLGCERVTIRGIQVWNFGNANNDGLDIDGCKDCNVSGCIFESDDDAITLKSTFERPCEGITIANCIARSHCNAIKMGTESNGGFKDIAISNCVITSPPDDAQLIYGMQRGMCGVALETVDGGILERIAIDNITIRGVNVPLFLRLGDRARAFKEGMGRPPVGSFRDVVIANVVATGAGKTGCSITGIPGHAIENVSLNNISLSFEGGGTRAMADNQVRELEDRYPESKMFGDLPAFGFYCRHVRGLRFSNLRFGAASGEQRHAMVFDDVENVSIAGFDSTFEAGGVAILKFIQSRDALITGCNPRGKDASFLKVSGADCRGITLVGNEFRGVGKISEFVKDAPESAVTVK